MLLENAFGLIVHGDDVRGVDNLHPRERHSVFRRHPADIRLVSRQEDGVAVLRHRQSRAPQNFKGSVIPAVGVDDNPQARLVFSGGFHGFATFLFIDPESAGPRFRHAGRPCAYRRRRSPPEGWHAAISSEWKSRKKWIARTGRQGAAWGIPRWGNGRRLSAVPEGPLISRPGQRHRPYGSLPS